MSTTVNYKGSTIATVNNETKTLNTAGTWVEGDITLVDDSTANLQSKSVSYTPSETAQSATVTADASYDGLSSVDISVGAISGTYVGSQVPTQAAQTIHPSTSAQTIASGKYLTGDQTIEAVTTTNLTAANIKSGVVVKVGSATDDDCVASVTGTAEDNLYTFISRGQLGAYTFTDSSFIDHCFRGAKFTMLTLPNLVSSIKDYMFYEAVIGTLNLPKLQTCRNNYFDRLQVTIPLSLPELVTCGGSAFQYCNSPALYLPKFVNATGQTAFKNMSRLTAISLPKCTTPGNYALEGCVNLAAADFAVLATIPQGLFNKCTKLDTLILRNTTAVTLSNINAFNDMGEKAVTVYVPSALVSTYPAMTNWSAVTGATLTFAAIEGSQYENYYADGTAIS